MKLCRFRLHDDPTPRSGLFHDGHYYETDGQQPIGIYKPDDITLLAPISRPPTIRDFMSFEQHVLNTRKKFGREGVQKEWYEAPAYFYLNPLTIFGHDEPVEKPSFTDEFDFELEVAVVIGASGKDIEVEEADSHILGFTILNDWTLRDVQRREARTGLGYAKSKDTATSIGPYLVTPDELESRIISTDNGAQYNLEMKVFLNGDLIGGGNLRDMHWTFAQMISQASKSSIVSVGDVIASGTVGTGSLLEHDRGYLKPGDEVVMQVERLGELRSRII
jgi:fumarylacetoacetate (FAA) hydrolase